MTIEEILAKLQEIANKGETRSLTAEEVTEYETLEADLKAAQKTQELRSRQAAYVAPSASVAAGVHVAPAKADSGLDVAFRSYLRSGVPNADIAELRAQGSTDSAGGYTIAPAFRQKLVEVQKQFGGLAAHVDVIETETGAELEFPTNDDTANTGGITGESAAVTSGTDFTFGTVALKAYKYTSTGGGSNLPLRVPVELIQDSAFDIESFIARKLGERIARLQASHWAVGTGTGQPFGIVHAGLAENKALTTGTTITYNDLLDLEAALDPAYEQNAKWVFNKATWVAIRKILDLEGRPLVQPAAAAGIGTAPQYTLLGYPVVIDQSFPAGAGDSTNFAVLGDLREAYVIRKVAPLEIIVSPHTRMANGEIEYVARERADGNIQNRKAYAILATQDV